MSDLLERATRAARDEYGPRDDDALAGERGARRLERALRPRRSLGRLRALVLVAASFTGAAAWAAASGRLPVWVHGSHDETAGAPTESPREPAGRRASVRPVPPAPTLEVPPEQEPVPVDAPASPGAPRVVDPPTPVRRPRPSPRPPEPKAAEPAKDLDALFRAAQDAHFVRKDPAAAVVAWDAYVAAAGPSGRMTLEARYHRAVALVRLGRHDDARAALAPFARGEYGSYRREDASRLLDALP